MLTIVLEDEYFDEENLTFETREHAVLQLEHSLISLSKWEAQFQKPFLGPGQKTVEEVLAYIIAMVITPGVGPEVLGSFTDKNIQQVQEYIDSTQSATTFGILPKSPGPSEVITSELIYYWMVAFNIPFECQTWHLNRLFSLIRICHIKNSKPKKHSRSEVAQRYAELNAQRKAALGTRG